MVRQLRFVETRSMSRQTQSASAPRVAQDSVPFWGKCTGNLAVRAWRP